ncbi:MAG: hypothetical protein KDA85_15035 [Planctomycetaceae bacterium]|nr:hypothetical protein [Planctomycetaceae bacterium]
MMARFCRCLSWPLAFVLFSATNTSAQSRLVPESLAKAGESWTVAAEIRQVTQMTIDDGPPQTTQAIDHFQLVCLVTQTDPQGRMRLLVQLRNPEREPAGDATHHSPFGGHSRALESLRLTAICDPTGTVIRAGAEDAEAEFSDAGEGGVDARDLTEFMQPVLVQSWIEPAVWLRLAEQFPLPQVDSAGNDLPNKLPITPVEWKRTDHLSVPGVGVFQIPLMIAGDDSPEGTRQFRLTGDATLADRSRTGSVAAESLPFEFTDSVWTLDDYRGTLHLPASQSADSAEVDRAEADPVPDANPEDAVLPRRSLEVSFTLRAKGTLRLANRSHSFQVEQLQTRTYRLIR